MTVTVTYFKGDSTSWVEHSNIDSVEIKERFIYLMSGDKVKACYNADKILYYSCK